MADIKGEYELNADAFYYHGYEYHREDIVPIPDDLDDAGKNHVAQLVDLGLLVDRGFAEKLREEEAKAAEDAEKARLEQVERDDAEAHRKVAAQERLLHGDPKVQDDDEGAAEKSASSKPAARRSSGSSK